MLQLLSHQLYNYTDDVRGQLTLGVTGSTGLAICSVMFVRCERGLTKPQVGAVSVEESRVNWIFCDIHLFLLGVMNTCFPTELFISDELN